MSKFQSSRLELALASEKLENEQLRQMIQQYQLAWECCEQGGNSSNNGVCSFAWQSKVNARTFFSSFLLANFRRKKREKFKVL